MRVLIVGLDSVAVMSKGLSQGSDVRQLATTEYRNELSSIIAQCVDRNSNDLHNFELVVVPAVGSFRDGNGVVWTFRGSVDHIFNITLHRVIKSIEEFKPNSLILDLTHGINYQAVSVLYATVAASILKDVERRLIIFNSEPIPTQPPKQVTQQEGRCSTRLSLLDISSLQSVIRFVRVITQLKYLNPSPLKEYINSELGETDVASPEIREQLNSLLGFVTLLANGMVALTYVGAKCMDGTSVSRLPNLIKPQIREYQPILKGYEVIYEPVDKLTPLILAVTEVIDYFKKETNYGSGESLGDYFKKVKKLYDNLGLRALYELARREHEVMGTVISFVAKHPEVLHKNFANYVLIDDVITLKQQLYRSLQENEHHIIKYYEGKLGVEELIKKLAEELKEHEDSPKRGDRISRHMVAHAGLEFGVISELKINPRRRDVVEIIYDCHKLKGILSDLRNGGELSRL